MVTRLIRSIRSINCNSLFFRNRELRFKRKKTKNSPAAHVLQIYPGDRLWLARVDEHIRGIITDLIS
jgi:hypothetical protein